MKKFLLSMIALVASFAASAAVVYFDNSTANWAAVSCYSFGEETMGKWPGKAMTQDENGLWSIDVVEGCTKIIFNNAGKGAQTGNLDYVPGATYNKDGMVGAAEQHIYFKNTANWSAVYIYTWQPEMFGSWPGTQLTPNADGLYEFTYTSAPAGLKFHDNGAGDTGDITEFNDGDVFDATGALVGDTPTPPTPPTPGGDKELYVIGNFCSWTLSAALKMDHVEGTNVYTLTTDAMDGDEWKINDGTWDWSFGASEGGTQPGVDNDAWFNSSVNFSGITGSTTITFTLVEGSDVEGSATPSVLSYTGAAAPTAPETLYLVGDMLGNHWDPSNGLELEKNGNVFTGTVEIETAFENDYGFFSFCTALGADSEDWNVGTRYGAEALNTPIAAGETVPFVKGDLSWQVLPGKYDVEVDFDANTVSLTANSSGIESVAVKSAAAAVYYNLQGVRVAAPEAGSLYIVKRGDKVSKEIVR